MAPLAGRRMRLHFWQQADEASDPANVTVVPFGVANHDQMERRRRKEEEKARKIRMGEEKGRGVILPGILYTQARLVLIH